MEGPFGTLSYRNSVTLLLDAVQPAITSRGAPRDLPKDIKGPKYHRDERCLGFLWWDSRESRFGRPLQPEASNAAFWYFVGLYRDDGHEHFFSTEHPPAEAVVFIGQWFHQPARRAALQSSFHQALPQLL
jgi:hypothetical protein